MKTIITTSRKNTLVALTLILALSRAGFAHAAETLFADYFDIKAGSAAGTDVVGKVNLLSNKDAHKVPVPADYQFTLTSDASGFFEIVNQRDSKSRLFGALRVKPGATLPTTVSDYPMGVRLSQGGTTLATATITVHAVSQTLYDKMLAYAIQHCRKFDRLFDRNRPTDAQVLDWITQVETNNGRFIDPNPNTPLDFYTRDIGSYKNTSGSANNLSSQWQRVGDTLGGMGFAYTNTDSRYSTTYGPNGTPANRLRLKNALMLALGTYMDRVPLDPAQALFDGVPIGPDFGDGVFNLLYQGVASTTDITHQWIWIDPVTGPSVWLMPDLLAGIRSGDAASIALHEKILNYFQLAFGAESNAYRNLRRPLHVWGGMAPELVGHTDGAFSDGNLGHRFRAWLTLPTLWADYNRPITYIPCWYDGYTWPGITPTLVTGPAYRFKPGFTPKGVLRDLLWWTNHSYPDTHYYVCEGANTDGTFSHHLRGSLNDVTMIAYGHESVIAPIPSMEMLRDFPGVTLEDEAYDRIADMWLYSYDKMTYKGDFDFVTTGINFLSNNRQFVSGIAPQVDRLLTARQPGTTIAQAAPLQTWAAALRAGTQAATGDFPFWVNNLLIHRKGGANADADSYYFSLKMGSDRTGNSDDASGKPFHMGSGLLEISTAGNEYDQSVRQRWDWHTLPGVTEEWRTDTIATGLLTSQVAGSPYGGMATDGLYGFGAMRYRPAASSTYATANANKFWFFSGDRAIALGTGIIRRSGMSGQGRPIVTTVQQCKWTSALTCSINGAAPTTFTNTAALSQDITLTAPTWLHQAGVGYVIFPQTAQPLSLRGGSAVIDSHADDTSAANLIQILLGHGVDPATSGIGKYFYVTVPNKTAADMPAVLAQLQSDLEMIGDGDLVQGVFDRSAGVIQIAFREAATATLASGLQVTVDHPALVQLRQSDNGWEVAATDPIHDFNAAAITVTVNLALTPGSYAYTLPGVKPRPGAPVVVTETQAGMTVRFTKPADDASTDYQGQLYSTVPMHATIAGDIQPAPKRLWKLDETSGATATESVSGAPDGTITGGSWTTGRFANALTLAGPGSGLTAAPLGFSGNAFTVTGWIKRNGGQSNGAGIAFMRNASVATGFNFGASDELGYTWRRDSGTYNWSSGLTPPDNTWTFVALVVSPTKATIYMDSGSGMVSSARNYSHAPENFAAAAFALGSDSFAPNRSFKGAMDDFRVYSRSLTAEQVRQLARVWQPVATLGAPAPAVQSASYSYAAPTGFSMITPTPAPVFTPKSRTTAKGPLAAAPTPSTAATAARFAAPAKRVAIGRKAPAASVRNDRFEIPLGIIRVDTKLNKQPASERTAYGWKLRWPGFAGTTYRIERSEDLENWISLESDWSPDDNRPEYIDESAPLFADRLYYRISLINN